MDPVLIARAERLVRMEREVRTGHRPFELRETDDGKLHLDGYASVFDTPYEIEDWLGTYTEEVVKGAFTKTLRERADVRLLINHGGLPLARTKSGTLLLAEDEIGLRSESDLDPEDPDVQLIRPKIARKDLGEMSFAFRTIRQEWDEDYTHRKLLEVKLYDVSVVTYPANPFTSVDLRGETLIRALVTADPEDLLAQVRASSSITREDVAKAHELLAGLLAAEGPANPARDTSSTMKRDSALRELELMRLGAR